MKITVIVSLVIFWTIITSLFTAWLVTHENEKLVFSLVDSQQTTAETTNITPDAVSKDRYEEVAKKQKTTASNSTNSPGITLTSVGNHNTADDCQIIIRDKVYDVTTYLYDHPPGADSILPYCGTDATQAFVTKDKKNAKNHSSAAWKMLAAYYIGDIGAQVSSPPPSVSQVTTPTNNTRQNVAVKGVSTSKPPVSNPEGDSRSTPPASNQQPPYQPPPKPVQKQALATNENTQAHEAIPSGLTTAEVARHSTRDDCWLIMNGKVYDFTNYLFKHPGGVGTITPYCGRDGTRAFEKQGHSRKAYSLFDQYYVGDLAVPDTDGNSVGNVANTASQKNTSQNNRTNEYPTDAPLYSNTVDQAINALFPGARIIKKEGGREEKEVKLIYEGSTYKVKLDSANNIVEMEQEDD